LTAQEKAEEIASINQQLNTLEEQVNNAKTETRKLIEKRNRLNEQFNNLRQEIHDLKIERDNLNEKVQTLKMLRDEIRTKTRTIIEELKAIGEKITELRKNTPERSQHELQEELDSIEWTIQTTSQELNEEKKLIENVKQLEMQLSAYRKIDKQKKKIADLRKDLKALDEKADSFHQELSSTAQKSQETHQKMLLKIDESKKIKLEADSLHSAYLQAKEKAEPANHEWRKLIEKRKKMQDSLREDEEKKRKTEEQILKEKLISQAKEKLQRGEKLSWDEFQLLAEEDSQTQD
jgi:uncharacterized coiled-coil DUF342 family protein